MREIVIEKYLVEQVWKAGGKAIKFTSSANRGVPDRMCLFPSGIVVFVECKRPGEKLDPLQVKWFEILKALGFLCIMIDTKPKVDALMKWYNRTQEVRNVTHVLEEGNA
jgi:Holliday junction resolvase